MRKIYSGGKPGVEQAALDTAIKLDIPYGGWIPKGKRTQGGVLSEKYELTEAESEVLAEARAAANPTEVSATGGED